MPNTDSYPFARISVDHIMRGGSRIWWTLLPEFADPGPHVFQLQVSLTGTPNARDWQNVGILATDAVYLVDDAQRLYGKTLLTHYRISLTTAVGTYVSRPVTSEGELSPQDLMLAREIIRKEQLRGGRFAWREGRLIKRMRYGARCQLCRDPLTGETTDSDCQQCAGTGYQIGYHPAVPLCLEFTQQKTNQETTDPSVRGSVNDVPVAVRCLGFPMLNKEDIWVDAHSDERWMIHEISYEAVIRGVPIIIAAKMRLLPYSHVAYRIDTECQVEDTLPGAGSGCVSVADDYQDNDLRYLDSNGDPIADADVIAFLASDFMAAAPVLPDISKAVAATMTDDNGQWVLALQLDPADYTIVFRKPGQFGPDHAQISVTRETGSSESVGEMTAPRIEVTPRSQPATPDPNAFWNL